MTTRAQDWRSAIQTETSKYDQTVGGSPPYQLLEAMVNVESGGDPGALQEDGGKGLAGLMAGGKYAKAYTDKYGREPNVMDPLDAIGVLTYTVDGLQESGMAAAEAGQSAGLQDWFGAALGYAGMADNTGVTKGRGVDAWNYLNATKTYMTNKIDVNAVHDVAKLQPGEYIEVTNDAGVPTGEVEYDPASAPIQDVDGNIDDTIDLGRGILENGIGIGVSKLTGFAASWAPRIGLFLIGAVVLALGGVMLAKAGK